MLKKIKLIFLLATLAAVMGACAGEDGEIGPAGEPGLDGEKGDKGDQGDEGDPGDGFEEIGSLTGTISGTRRDGTAFSKLFSYKYSVSNQMAFYEENGVTRLDIDRNAGPQSDDYFDFQLKLEDGTLKPASAYFATHIAFSEEENSTTLFSLNARAFYGEMQGFVKQLKDELNDAYHFYLDTNGQINYNSYNLYVEEKFVPVYSFDASMNGTSFDVYFHQETGALFAVEDPDADLLLFSGEMFDFYSDLKFVHNPAVGIDTFFDAETNEDLSEVIPTTPPDEFVVTNYNHDPSTGILTFDFVLQIDENEGSGARINSTNHDLTVTGSYNSGVKVYASTVGRTKND
jgi:hypothetical protein